MPFPKQKDIELPLLQVLHDVGGTAKPRDIYPRVAAYFPQLSPEELEQKLESSASTRKWWNLVQWVRQLVEQGQLDGEYRGVWTLTEAGRERLKRNGTEWEAYA